MKAEERLARLSLQLDAHPNSLSGDIEKLAREAIALLRCGMNYLDRYDPELAAKVRKFLDGEP